jgi:hypothetical protein
VHAVAMVSNAVDHATRSLIAAYRSADLDDFAWLKGKPEVTGSPLASVPTNAPAVPDNRRLEVSGLVAFSLVVGIANCSNRRACDSLPEGIR